MKEEDKRAIQALKAGVYADDHEIELCELIIKNRREARELKLDRIDQIEMGDDNE